MKRLILEIPDDVKTGFIFRALAETAREAGCKLESENVDLPRRTTVYRMAKRYSKQESVA